MKIYDCFMYFDEDVVLDVRLNVLDKYVDKFVIIESIFNHKGEKRKPLFDINKFQSFNHKINYILLETQPDNLEEIHPCHIYAFKYHFFKNKRLLCLLLREI